MISLQDQTEAFLSNDLQCFTVLDINECSSNNVGCSTNAVCTNTPGSFTCACSSGYTGNGVSCSGKNLLSVSISSPAFARLTHCYVTLLIIDFNFLNQSHQASSYEGS